MAIDKDAARTALIGTISYIIGYTIANILPLNLGIPKNTNSCFVNPREVKWVVEDRGTDKLKETYIQYRGKEYAAIENLVNGELKLIQSNEALKW